MAYFDCIVGGASGMSIPLVVTCSSDFAGLTITCTDGNTTLTDTCPSSSPYEVTFYLPDTGTWTVSGTISGTTYSESVLVNEFDVELSDYVDITVDVYSAADDTVSYVGTDGQTHTITTDSNGHASALFTVVASGSTLQFTSTVAKNPSDLSLNYSKNITLNRNTTTIYVMPDGALYWYGWSKLGAFSKNGYTIYGHSLVGGSALTNKLNIPQVSSNTYRGVGSENSFTISNTFSKIKAHLNTSGYSIGLSITSSKNLDATSSLGIIYDQIGGEQVAEASINSYGTGYVFFYAGNKNQYGDCYAVWLE